MTKIDVVCPRCFETKRVIRNGHSSSGVQLYRCKHRLETFQLSYRYNGANPETDQTIVDMAMNVTGCRKSAEDKPQYCSPSFKKLTPHQVVQNVEPGAEVVICCEADEQ